MLSVLIPIYNYNTINLVKAVHSQLESLQIKFEVICICDASKQFIEENKIINTFSNSQLITLNKNIGRSKIRNLLAEKSKFNWLLFLDADVFPKDGYFITRYLEFIEAGISKVCCGGLLYEGKVNDKSLRRVYGINREEISVKKRKERPYQFVSGANLLICKSIFNKIKFNERVLKYGYEDVLFIEKLKQKRIVVSHIENPVFHQGIEDSFTFLNKTKEAIENLISLRQRAILIGDNLKLTKTFMILSSYKLTWILTSLFYFFKGPLEKNLLGKRPSLFLFDLYKLGYLCSASRKN